jgi:DNA-binding response OmpR family regulator
MALVLLVGGDPALLEGLAQSLATAGHAVRTAVGYDAAHETAAREAPLVLLAEHPLHAVDASWCAALLRMPLAPGGARVLFRATSDAGSHVSAALRRGALADLALPLERQRLLALVQSVEERAHRSGRSHAEPSSAPRVG